MAWSHPVADDSSDTKSVSVVMIVEITDSWWTRNALPDCIGQNTMLFRWHGCWHAVPCTSVPWTSLASGFNCSPHSDMHTKHCCFPELMDFFSLHAYIVYFLIDNYVATTRKQRKGRSIVAISLGAKVSQEKDNFLFAMITENWVKVLKKTKGRIK